MLKAFTIVIMLSLVGDLAADALRLPVPGAAIGLILLILLFVRQGGPDPDLGRLFDAVTPIFPLFFVPAAVGVVANAGVLSEAWVHVAAAIVVSTAATLAVTGLVAQALLRPIRQEEMK